MTVATGRKPARWQAANEWLRETWLELRNGSGPERRAYFAGALDVLQDIGILTAEEQAETLAQSRHCPGHEGFEAGRDWCGFGCHLPAAFEILETTS